MFIGIGLPITSRFGVSSAISSGALDLLAGDDGLALDFTDDTWFTDSGFYGSAAVVGGGTQDGYNSTPDGLLTYTSPSAKVLMGPSGTLYTTSGGQLPYRWTSAGVLEGIVVEEARTNLVDYSQSFSNAAWTNLTTTLSSGAVTGPDGLLSGWSATQTATNAFIANAGPVVSGSTYASSFVLKRNATDWVLVAFLDTGLANGVTGWFNLATGAKGTLSTLGTGGTAVSSSISDLGNGWYRCTIVGSITSTTGSPFVRATSADNTIGAVNGGTYYVYHCQSELGSFETSIIPTVASTVTRAADTKNNATTISPSIATAGTWVVNAKTAPGTGTQVLAQLDDGTANERYRLVRDSSNNIRFIVTDGGVEQANLNLGTVANDTEFTAAVAWAANDIAGCINGGTVQTDATATLPTVTTKRYGSSSSGEHWNGIVKTDVLFNTRKANATLQTLSA